LLGWAAENEEILSLNNLIHQLSAEHISKAPVIFDINKLKWMNGMYLKQIFLEQFHELLLPYDQSTIRTLIY